MCLSYRNDCHRAYSKETGCPKYGFLFLRREIIAFLYVGIIQRIRNVRYYRHNADGILGIRLWLQKSLDSLVMAGIQSDIPHGLPVRVVTSFQRAHRRGMD